MYGSGPVTDLDTCFGGKLKVDQPLRELLLSHGEEWEVTDLGLEIDEAEKGMSDRDISMLFTVCDVEEGVASFIFATLYHLDNENEQETLKIPEGDDETDVIICYIGEKVVYLEHEREDGKEEEWHLHMRPKKTTGWKRAPKVVTVIE